LPTRFNDDAEKCLDGSKARRIGNMEHHTFTQRSLMLVEARFEASGADPEPVNFSEPCSELVGFEVGRTHQLKWSRGATALRKIGCLKQAASRVHQCRLECWHIG